MRNEAAEVARRTLCCGKGASEVEVAAFNDGSLTLRSTLDGPGGEG